MIPVGYIAKRVEKSADWLSAPNLSDINSVSVCISDGYADFIDHWRHNAYWLFDNPEIIRQIAVQNSIHLDATQLFYYTVHEYQFNQSAKAWESFAPEPSCGLNVEEPASALLEGFDILSFAGSTGPECSPRSCNGLVQETPTNRHCLLASLEEALNLLERGRLVNCEPGPYRV